MPNNLVKSERDEELWAKATTAAEKQGKSKNYAYINGIYQKMKGHKKTAGVLAGVRRAMGLREATPEEQEAYRWKYHEGASPDARKAMALIGGPAEGFDEMDWYEALMAYENKHGVRIPESEWDDPSTFKFPNIAKHEKQASLLNAISKFGGFGPHQYSSTQIQLPDDIERVVKAEGIEIPDEDLYSGENNPDKDAWNGFGRESDFHVTLKYGLHTDDPSKVKAVLSEEKPIKAKIGKISMFEQDDHDVIKFDIDSDDLHRLNKKISDALEHTTTFPDYKPHATVAYVKKGKGKELVGDASITGKEFVVSEIIFSGKSGKRTSIKLTGNSGVKKTASLLHAISSLGITRDNVNINAPIHEAEGDFKQAELDRDVASSCGTALNLLSAIEKTSAILTSVSKLPHVGDKVVYVDVKDPDKEFGEHLVEVKFDSGQKTISHYHDDTKDKVKKASTTPLLDGIQKHAVSKLMWGLGGLGGGVVGVPWLKKKYIGVHPETQQLLEQGDPNYGIQKSPRMPFNPYLNRPDRNR